LSFGWVAGGFPDEIKRVDASRAGLDRGTTSGLIAVRRVYLAADTVIKLAVGAFLWLIIAIAAGQQEQLAQGLGVVHVVVIILPLLVDVFRMHEWARIIASNRLAGFFGQVKCIGDAAP
jgi:hypothetical protein